MEEDRGEGGQERVDERPTLTKFGLDTEEDQVAVVSSLFHVFFFSSTFSCAVRLSAAERKDGVLEAFSRSNSVRDRMRRFNDAAQSSASVPASRATPPGQGKSSRVTASVFTPKVPAASPAGQWQSSRGGTTTGAMAESRAQVAADSEADKVQGRAVSQQEAQQEGEGAAEPDMKTFLTIEIKDGRSSATTSSSAAAAAATSSTRGNIVPISTLTPRFSANSLGQRTGRGQSAPRGQRAVHLFTLHATLMKICFFH